jgi:hypothetical protein
MSATPAHRVMPDKEFFEFVIKVRRHLDKIKSESDTLLLHTIVDNVFSKGLMDEKYRHVKSRKIPLSIIDCLTELRFRQTVRNFGLYHSDDSWRG